MEYYKLLQLDREPFSNSPDPDYFFQSGQHLACLQKLELALRLKRGLNVIIGDVGTGKTTLCRQLIRKFSQEPEFETSLILDPSFGTPHDFLKHLHELISGQKPAENSSDLDMKESIKQVLFKKGVDQSKTVAMIIDEGQKISPGCLEILRELLNFETNTSKLLQIVIFAQLEFQQLLDAHANFADRINLLHHLQPMNFKDTRQMVHHRIKLASPGPRPKKLFTYPAMWAIYRASHGYPRKIINLCHQSLLAMIIQNRSQAGWQLIRSCKRRISPSFSAHRRLVLLSIFTAIGLVILIGLAPEFLSRHSDWPGRNEIVTPTPVYSVPEPPQGGEATTSQLTETSPVIAMPHQEAAQAEAAGPATPPPATSAAPAADMTRAQPPAAGEPVREEASASVVADPPDLLGQLVVKPGDTIAALTRAVYGIQSNVFLRAVVEANPQIEDPNTINIGDLIAFPAMKARHRDVDGRYWWVILDEDPALPVSLNKLNQLSALFHLPLQIIANWSLDNGLRFPIAIRGYYASEQAAAEAARGLPDRVASHCRIIHNWPRDTIFFADPTLGGVLKKSDHSARP
jgi:general secretion pathway protein A